jgi:hypothetical protein
MRDRRTLPLGIVLLLLGAFFLLSRRFHWSGPGVILAMIGTTLLALSAARKFRGPLLPAGILLGLGFALVFQRPLESVFPRWATILLGLGAGFLLVAAIDLAAGRERRPSPLLAGALLVVLAGLGALSQSEPGFRIFAGIRDLWPWALVVAGAVIVGQALLRSRKR